MSNPVPCQNCGAMMQPEPDPRVFHCAYCNTRVQVGVSGEQLAQGLALDLANVDTFLAHLANTLAAGFAEHTRIQASGRVVNVIEIDLEPDCFSVSRSGAHAVAQHKRVVRGIALKTQTLALDRWVELLFDALARHSNDSQRAAWVLGRLGGRR